MQGRRVLHDQPLSYQAHQDAMGCATFQIQLLGQVDKSQSVSTVRGDLAQDTGGTFDALRAAGNSFVLLFRRSSTFARDFVRENLKKDK
jgi:hypothetical protein